MFLLYIYVDKFNSVVFNGVSKGFCIQYVFIVLELSKGLGVFVCVCYGQDNIQKYYIDGYFFQYGEYLKFFLFVNL